MILGQFEIAFKLMKILLAYTGFHTFTVKDFYYEQNEKIKKMTVEQLTNIKETISRPSHVVLSGQTN